MRKLTIDIGLLRAGAEYNLSYLKIGIPKQTMVDGVWELDRHTLGHIKNLSCCSMVTLELLVMDLMDPWWNQWLHVKWNHSCLLPLVQVWTWIITLSPQCTWRSGCIHHLSLDPLDTTFEHKFTIDHVCMFRMGQAPESSHLSLLASSDQISPQIQYGL